MPRCHVCPDNVPAQIEAGKLKNTPWEELPCSTCELNPDVPYNKGRTHVSFEHLPDSEMSALYAQAEKEQEGVNDYLYNRSIEVLTEVIRGFALMDSMTRDIVCARILGHSYRKIGANIDRSPTAVIRRVQRAVKKWPILAKVV